MPPRTFRLPVPHLLRRLATLGALGGGLVTTLSCSQPTLLVLTLQGLSSQPKVAPAATSIKLHATINGESRDFERTVDSLGNVSADSGQLALQLDAKYVGSLELEVEVLSDLCVVQRAHLTLPAGQAPLTPVIVALPSPNPGACLLTVNIAGSGAPGSTVKSDVGGLSCPGVCRATITQPGQVVVTATPAPNTVTSFTPNTGCSGNVCTIPLSSLDGAGYTLNAAFDPIPSITNNYCALLAGSPTAIITGASYNWKGVFATTDKDVRLVGNNIYQRFDRSATGGLDNPDRTTMHSLRGIFGVSATSVQIAADGAAVSDDGSSRVATGVGFPGDVWNASWGSSSNSYVLVGANGLGNGVFAYYNGSGWTRDLPMWNFGPKTLNGVWGLDSNNVFAVGNNHTLVRGKVTGTTGDWADIPSNPLASSNLAYRGIFGTSRAIWVVGESGTVLRSSDLGVTFTKLDLSKLPSSGTAQLNAIWANGARLIAVGDGQIAYCQDLISGSWYTLPQPSGLPVPNLYGVYGYDKKVWVVGDAGSFIEYQFQF